MYNKKSYDHTIIECVVFPLYLGYLFRTCKEIKGNVWYNVCTVFFTVTTAASVFYSVGIVSLFKFFFSK